MGSLAHLLELTAPGERNQLYLHVYVTHNACKYTSVWFMCVFVCVSTNFQPYKWCKTHTNSVEAIPCPHDHSVSHFLKVLNKLHEMYNSGVNIVV